MKVCIKTSMLDFGASLDRHSLPLMEMLLSVSQGTSAASSVTQSTIRRLASSAPTLNSSDKHCWPYTQTDWQIASDSAHRMESTTAVTVKVAGHGADQISALQLALLFSQADQPQRQPRLSVCDAGECPVREQRLTTEMKRLNDPASSVFASPGHGQLGVGQPYGFRKYTQQHAAEPRSS